MVRTCSRELKRNDRYALCEATPSGFSICRIGETAPISTYPNHIHGWYEALGDFYALTEQADAEV